MYGTAVTNLSLAATADNGNTHFLLGWAPDWLEHLQSTIANTHPFARFVGAKIPPFSLATALEVFDRNDRIRANVATVVWVGLTWPSRPLS